MRARYSRRFKRRVGRYVRRYRRKQTTRKRYHRRGLITRLGRDYKTCIFKLNANFSIDVQSGTDTTQEFGIKPTEFNNWTDINDSYEEYKVKWIKFTFIPLQNQTFAHSPASGTAPIGFDDNKATLITALTLDFSLGDTSSMGYDRISNSANAIRTISTRSFSLFRRLGNVTVKASQALNESNLFDISIPNPWIRCNSTASNVAEFPVGCVAAKSLIAARTTPGNTVGYTIVKTMKVVFRSYKNNSLK